MTAAARELLSREELAALLDAVAERKRRAAEAQSVFASRGQEASHERERFPLVRRALENFAADYGKGLGGRFQTSIQFELVTWQELSVGDLIDTLLPEDAAVTYLDEMSGRQGVVVLNRPLAFDWLALAFGSGERRSGGIPDRAYTRIEAHFLKRIAAEALERLVASTVAELRWKPRAQEVESAQTLQDRRSELLSLATFDVRGLGNLCRMRIGIPPAVLSPPDLAPDVARSAADTARQDLLALPVTLRAELGRAHLPVGRVRALQVGEHIELGGAGDGVLSIRVEGAPKFKARRGRRGARLAVQIVERVKGGGGSDHA